MKFKTFFFPALAFFILFFETGSFGAENKTLNSPSAFVPESRYVFTPVLDGTEITHDFIIQNRGTAVLNIEKVKTG
jgi:hypothetical protein